MQAIEKSTRKIVFHCHYSQSRGPTAAAMFYADLRTGEMIDNGLEVLILSGGFKTWRQLFEGDPLLYEYLSKRSS